jgi:hypothetical protein
MGSLQGLLDGLTEGLDEYQEYSLTALKPPSLKQGCRASGEGFKAGRCALKNTP